MGSAHVCTSNTGFVSAGSARWRWPSRDTHHAQSCRYEPPETPPLSRAALPGSYPFPYQETPIPGVVLLSTGNPCRIGSDQFLWLLAFWEVNGIGCLALGWHLGMFLHPPMDLDAVGLRKVRNYLPTLPSQELNYFSQLNFCD